MQNIFKTIREERDDFLNNEIEVVPGYNFSQYATVKKIHLYFNSHYEKGDYEVINGVRRKKAFHNLSTWRCEVATKMIDLDVKDFVLISNIPDQDFNVFLLEKELKVWLKRHKLGLILNEISRLLPIYGSVILEKTKEGAQMADLRYIYNDQSAATLNDARYINKKMFLSHQDLRKMAKKGWENTNEAIENFSGKYQMGYDPNGLQTAFGNSSGNPELFYEGAGAGLQPKSETSPLVEVWQRVGQVPLSWFTDKEKDENEYVLAKYVVAGIDQYSMNEEKTVVIEENGLVLYKEQIDEIPFMEVHYNKTEGRWLGIGIVETLFEAQRRMNEIKNQEAHAIELGSIQLFQTRDTTVANNILTDLENGGILKTKSEITPIATESRQIQSFANAAQILEEQANNLTFSRDVVSGDTPPSSATLGAVQIQTQQTTAVFDYKKENISIPLSYFIKDLVFPQLEKELNKAHTLRLAGSFNELTRLRNNHAVNYANKKCIEAAIQGKGEITQELFDFYKQQALDDVGKMGDKIWVEVQKDFFKNLDYEVDIEITGESRNMFAQIQNAQALLQTLAADPTILQDPVKKKLVFKVMSNMGMHFSELEDMENQQTEAITNNQTNGIQMQTAGQGQGQAAPALA